MKPLTVALVAILSAGNVALVIALSRSAAEHARKDEEIRALNLRVSDCERLIASWREVQSADTIRDALSRALKTGETWQRLFEDCDRPLEIGDRIDGALVCRIDKSGVYTLDLARSAEVRREIRTMPAGIRCRAALGIALAE